MPVTATVVKNNDINDPGEGEISEDYANKMHIEQDVVNFEMSDTYAKSVPLEYLVLSARTLL